MRKIVRMGVLLLVVLGLGACMGRNGNPYILFDWTTAPTTFSTELPGVPLFPLSVNQREEYLTQEGGPYRTTYYHPNPPAPDPGGTTRWIDVWITVHEGEFLTDGKDSIFEIYLYATGDPTFIQLRSLTPASTAGQLTQAEQPLDKSDYEEQTLGTFEQIRGGYKMTGTYGVYVPKQ